MRLCLGFGQVGINWLGASLLFLFKRIIFVFCTQAVTTSSDWEKENKYIANEIHGYQIIAEYSKK